ncbi:VOC family protein [Gottfriedia luciferensis]|uniref:VOC family protein n=1 Tax=Gottfriedia luciferensis TaxID=178774 RepID=UPI000B447249|nr:VOC family protein [Gottfriedia luciferensis]
MQKITTFLMFEGQAEEAMNYYISLFKDSEVVNILRYGPEMGEFEGKVIKATFKLNGQEFICIDSNIKHNFTFTPSVSLFVTCESDEEIENAYEKLTDNGQVLMPLGAYPFSEKYGWVNDKYGVSWQLTLVKK